MDVDPKVADIIKPTNRISQRRGLGSLTLVNHQESMLVSESGTTCTNRLDGNREASCWLAEAVVEERNQPAVSSKREKMSYFRSMQQHGTTDVVTVEELSRDCPPAGLSPASSPSSKYRASLPGCSPRWPHTYHHGTIFSFPSLPSPSSSSSSSSVSSSASHRRRRLFYPFSSVGLLACNRYAASRRLSTVVEKPVGDAASSIQLASYHPPIHNCAFLVGGVDSVLGNTEPSSSSLDLKSADTTENRDVLSSLGRPSLESSSSHPPGLSQTIWLTTAARRTVNHFASHLEESPLLLSPHVCPSQQQQPDCEQHRGPQRLTATVDEAQEPSGQQETTTLSSASAVCQYTGRSSLGVVDLPSRRHHRQSAYRVDNNRTTGDFCTNRARAVSLNCNSRGARSRKSLSTWALEEEATIPDTTTVDRHHNQRRHQNQLSALARESTDDDHVLRDSSSVVWRPHPISPSAVNTSAGQAMDRHPSSSSPSPVAPPMTSLYAGVAPTSHGANATSCCASIDGLGVATSQSPSSVALSGPIFTSRHYVNCKNPEIACKTCSCDACREHGPSSNIFPRQSTMATPSKTVGHTDVQQQTQSNSFAEHQVTTDLFSFPHRPARSRSPNATFCNSHGEAVRDRRAYSADRPVNYPPTDGSTSTAKASPKTNTGSTKVERLRQLTQRLRPSSSITSKPPELVRPVATLEPIHNQQLPPIPIAPPRHPRVRSERKKSSRSKKDSATSTSDLTLPARSAPSVASTVTEVPSLENGSITKDEAACASIALPIAEESPLATKGLVHQPQDSNLFSDTAHKSSSNLVNQPIPNSENDFFDEVHLTLSKLNPRIMVGTYQQRTIPFRSASFSQIDVGADGTYNRRPRTSITLKPVTYSIGKDASGNSSLPHSASLPRRLKINDRNPEESTTPPIFHLGAEDPKEIPTTPNVNSTADEYAKDLAPLCESEVTTENGNPVTDERNQPVVHQELEHSSTALLQEDRCLSGDGVLENLSPVNVPDVQDDVQLKPIHREDLVEYVGHGPCVSEETEKTAENIDVTCYETTEISVSAEIRLSPVPTVNSETIDLDMSVNLVDAEPLASSSTKPLPVLDLLELNNHLLRLRAATRDSTLDRLADLEVAAQFGDSTVPVPSIDSSGVSSRNGVVVKHGSSDQSDNRPWLNELLRLTNYERDESGWSPSDEGCVADSTECSSQPAGDCPVSIGTDSTPHGDNSCRPIDRKSVSFVQPDTTLPTDSPIANLSRGATNKRAVGRRSSKRRRHSSSTNNSSLTTGTYAKCSRGRSLTFPPVWSSKMCSLYGIDPVFGRASELSSLDDDDGLPAVVDMDKFKSKRVVFGAEDDAQIADSTSITEPASPDAFTDSFHPIIMAAERNALLYPKCSLAEISHSQLLQLEEAASSANENSSPASRLTPMGSSLEEDHSTGGYTTQMSGNQLLIAGSHYASVESDEPEDCREHLLQPNLSEAENVHLADQSDASNCTTANEDERSQTNHRLTVSLSVTLAPELSCANPSSLRNMSLSPYCSDLETNSFGLSPEKVQRSPVNPRRYGLKRRPLRGPYGEMLEAEMNKSEFSKMYAKRNEDLNFLRELTPRINRDAKSSSPRPLSPQPSGGMPIPVGEPTTSNWTNIAANVRQNSMTLPTSHSLDDSQLKIGYNSATLPIEISASPRHPRLGLPKRKASAANNPYDLVDSDLEVNNCITGVNLIPVAVSPPLLDCVENRHALPTVIESGVRLNSMPLPSHQRTSSSPCQLVLNEGGFTSEDEPELLELTSLSSLSRSTAQLLGSDSANADTLPVTRIGSGKRSRVNTRYNFLKCIP